MDTDTKTEAFPIDMIIVPEGRRKVSEERVKELAGSIEEIGLLQPIILVDEAVDKARLVAGLHRLNAFKMLERERIPAVRRNIGDLDVELAEIDENLIREDLSPSERASLTARRKQIYLARYPETKHGGAPGKAGGGKKKAKDPKSGSFVKTTSKKTGRSRSSISDDVKRGEKVDEKVLNAISGTDLDTGVNLDVLAKLTPERQKEVVEHAMENGIKNLKTAKKGLEKSEAIANIEKEPEPLPEGPFRVIACDFPWPYDRVDDPTHRGSIPYPSMSIEEGCEMDVESIAHDDCILWFWTTNSFMHEACHMVDAWGFKPKTILTWKKPRMGVGNWLRNITEHCILAVRGNPVVNLTNQTTLIEGEVREHSRKPKSFYSLVEELCPGSKVELFARQKRDGWHSWGSETEKFEESS